MTSQQRLYRRFKEERRVARQAWSWPSSPDEYRLRVEALPAAFKLAPQVADYLLSHGSLQDGSPTISAVDFLAPQLLVQVSPGSSGTGFPSATVQDYEQWLDRVADQMPWAPLTFRSSRRGEGHIRDMLLELDRALKAFDLALNPAPDGVPASQWHDAALIQGIDMGHLELSHFPFEITCPACGWSGGGGTLKLVRLSGTPARLFQCDEEENVYDEFPFPWFQSLNRAPTPPVAEWGVPYSVLGTDYRQICRVLRQTWDDRVLLRQPVESAGWGRVDTQLLVLQSSEPLGPWGLTVFEYRVIPAGESPRIAVTGLGHTIPDAAESMYQWWSDQAGMPR
ncbi:hypothetical protein [Deinococcus sp.]|uniref:hypothetical protein n=1 Tax=Deinococcus sp. TaxID=47478 RepID=UPI002869898B|nr:hypothetical protein [Deinococcus sp.]